MANSAFSKSSIQTPVSVANGGTGLSSLGTAGQVIKVNDGETALEFGAVASGTTTMTAAESIAGATAPVAVAMVPTISDSARSKYADNTKTTDNNVYGTNWIAQTFVADGFNRVSHAAMWVNDSGSIANLVSSIYAVDGNDKPTGSPLETTGVANLNGWGPYEWQSSGAFSTHTLTPGVTYAIVFSIPSGDISNYGIFGSNSAGIILDGNMLTSSDSGSTWTHSSAADLTINIYGINVNTLTPGRVASYAGKDKEKNAFVGFAVTTATSGNDISVTKSGIVTGFTGLTTGNEYYLQDDGTLDVTPQKKKEPVGVATSTTALYLFSGDSRKNLRSIIASNNLLTTPLGFYRGTSASPQKTKEIEVNMIGKVRVMWEMIQGASSGTASSQVYVNDSGVGSTYSIGPVTASTQSYSTDVDVVPGDLVQLYQWRSAGYCDCYNFRLCGDDTPAEDTVVNLNYLT